MLTLVQNSAIIALLTAILLQNPLNVEGVGWCYNYTVTAGFINNGEKLNVTAINCTAPFNQSCVTKRYPVGQSVYNLESVKNVRDCSNVTSNQCKIDGIFMNCYCESDYCNELKHKSLASILNPVTLLTIPITLIVTSILP